MRDEWSYVLGNILDRTRLDHIEDTFKLAQLEKDALDECKCESNHRESTCSITVTHIMRIKCRGLSGLICTNSATADLGWIESGGRCAGCKNRASDCWVIVPV